MKTLPRTIYPKSLSAILTLCAIAFLPIAQTVHSEELPPRGPVPFHIYDIDSNGCITPDELARVQQLKMQRRQNMRQGQGMGMGQGQGMGQGRGMGMGQGQGMGRGGQQNRPKFEDFDKNKDGYISEQELIEARSMRISERIQQGYQMKNTGNITQFEDIDSNSDGRISQEEFINQQQRHQQERRRAY